MNPMIDKILFCLICIQLGMVLVNNTQIISGMTLTSGEVNNAFSGDLLSPTSSITILTDLIHSLNLAVDYIMANDYTPIIISEGSDLGAFGTWGEFSIRGDLAWILHKIAGGINAGIQLVFIILTLIYVGATLLYSITVGSIGFYSSVFSLFSKDKAWLYGTLLGVLQTLLITYYLTTIVLEILGSKGKSVATGGAAGQ